MRSDWEGGGRRVSTFALLVVVILIPFLPPSCVSIFAVHQPLYFGLLSHVKCHSLHTNGSISDQPR